RNLTEDEVVEEAVADMHADWTAGQSEARGFLRTAFERIRNFLEALGNALRGNGFQSAAGVFRRIGSGEVGRRQSGGQAGARFFGNLSQPQGEQPIFYSELARK